MIASVHNDSFIKLSSVSDYEGDRLENFFTKKLPNSFIIVKKSSTFNPNESFIQDRTYIPFGLWSELMKCCEKDKLNLSFTPDFNAKVCDDTVVKEEFVEYCLKLFENARYQPKMFQIEAAYNAIYYRKSCMEVTTNGGKTLICYMIFKYLRDVKGIKHILYVTPKTVLTEQSSEKFIEYDKECGIETDWTYSEITANSKKKDIYDDSIVFSNYQSLRNKEYDFFEKFDCVLVDEAHHSTAKSFKNILLMTRGAKYIIGMTGTFPMDSSYDSFVIQSYIGPLVYKYTSQQLIEDEKFATPVEIRGILMSYMSEDDRRYLYGLRKSIPDECPEMGSKIYDIEQDMCRRSTIRTEYICDIIKKTTKNTLVIFTDVKTGYGYNIYTNLRETTKKNVYYIDGNTKVAARSQIKQAMEDDTTGNTIIVSTIGCFSEGIDICNLWNIFLVESTKSVVSVAQLLGRGMRRYPGKDKTIVIDFGDDCSYVDKEDKNSAVAKRKSKNYLYKQFMYRGKIYKNRRFPYSFVTVDCRKRKLY